MNDYVSNMYINHRDPMVQYYRNEFGVDWYSEYIAFISRNEEEKRENVRKIFRKFFGIFKTSKHIEKEKLNTELVF